MESAIEKWSTKVTAVTIGATKEQGGTRTSTVTVGGMSTLPFLHFEGATPNPPAVAIEIQDVVPEGWSEELEAVYKDVWGDPVAWAKKAVEEYKADMICLRLAGIHPDFGNKSADHAAKVVDSVLKAVGVPLIVWGCYDNDKDNEVMPRVSEAARGENCLLGSARQENYKTLAAVCLADGHKIISESPLDINISKQVNILLSEMGIKAENIVLFQTTGALGYGLEYAYSMMERARLAGLQGDKMLIMPEICTVGLECWRVKEARVPESAFPQWGEARERGPLWELVTATTLLQAGGEIFVMRHPKAVAGFKSAVAELMKQ